MLSALKPTDDNGAPVNRECIYEECRFFNLEHRDCNLMMASRAMIQAAQQGGARTPASSEAPSTALVDMERRLTDIGKGLLHASLEVQGVVREAGQATLGGMAEVGDSLARRLDGIEARLASGPPEPDAGPASALQEIDGRIAAGLQQIQGMLASVLEHLPGQVASAMTHVRGDAGATPEQAIARLQARVDEQSRGVAATAAATSQALEQLSSLNDQQQKIAERLLEEMSLVSANSRKMEQAVSSMDKKMERVGEEVLQSSQLLTLVKGQTEKTHAALRGLNEGNRSVIQAIETQLQRDQADLGRRQREEALECNNRGVALYYRGALEAALEAFRRAIEVLPDYAEAHNNLGLVLSKMGKHDEAVQAFQEALRLDPAMGEVYNNLGFLYHTTAQLDRAVEMFGQAIQSSGDSSVAYTNLGNCLYKMKQPEKAVEAWRRALELDPMNENARRGLRMFQQEPGNN
ncbi:MAG: hypothetical protein AUH92_04990 [Acidobacteria bacterium 13_1_40CM_4_69_4]|nr:MAG: hypothetical protein AUH92_04990 [Acidobacteria bacterium 13_1_40CM_4_69_4]